MSRRYGPLHVREREGDRSPACVLVHGLAVSHRYLMPTARHLTGRRVLVPDLLGFGHSAKPRKILSVDEHAAVLARWLDDLGLSGACLLGNSFGCQVAVALAVTRPDLASALVLVGPTTDPTARSSVRQTLRWMYDTIWEEKWQTRIIAKDVRDAGLRRILGTLRLSVTDKIENRLPNVTVPTLFVRGEKDRIVPARWMTEAAALVPGAEQLTIKSAAHNAVTTAGDKLAAEVDAFLARCPR